MPGFSWFYHGPPWSRFKKDTRISGISNSEPRAELALEVEVEGKDRCARFKKLKPNQDDAFDHFLSAKRLHTRPSPCSTSYFEQACNYKYRVRALNLKTS